MYYILNKKLHPGVILCLKNPCSLGFTTGAPRMNGDLGEGAPNFLLEPRTLLNSGTALY